MLFYKYMQVKRRCSFSCMAQPISSLSECSMLKPCVLLSLFACIRDRNQNTRSSGRLSRASMATTMCTLTPPSYRTITSGSFRETTCVLVSALHTSIKIICSVCLHDIMLSLDHWDARPGFHVLGVNQSNMREMVVCASNRASQGGLHYITTAPAGAFTLIDRHYVFCVYGQSITVLSHVYGHYRPTSSTAH